MAHSNNLFEIGLILFVVVWTAWAGQQTENGVVFYDGIDAEVIITNGKILAKHVSRGKRATRNQTNSIFPRKNQKEKWRIKCQKAT